MKKLTKTLLALSVVGAFSGMAQASSTEEMTVTAKVVGDCTVAINDIDFGEIYISHGDAPNLKASGSVVATCPSGANFFFAITSPNRVSGKTTSRMVNTNDPSKKLVYDLWADEQGTIGAFDENEIFQTTDFTTTTRTFNVYAELEPTMSTQAGTGEMINARTGQGKAVVEGTYVDTLIIHINYADPEILVRG